MPPAATSYCYLFTFPDGSSRQFIIDLDENISYRRQQHHDRLLPKWALLSHEQCRHCPFSPETTQYCPVAANTADLVTAFLDTVSYNDCQVSCVTGARTVSKDTTVQDGLSSILGMIMATSNCPSLSLLKPLAYFHLPFATVEETLFRAASSYLLRQYFIAADGGEADFSLAIIGSHYSDIQKVNAGILRRIHSAARSDADKNALIILNSLAQILEMELADQLESLRPLFAGG